MNATEITTIIVSVLAGGASIFSVYFAYTKFKVDDLKKKKLNLKMVIDVIFGKESEERSISIMMLSAEATKSIKMTGAKDERDIDMMINENLTSYSLGLKKWKEVTTDFEGVKKMYPDSKTVQLISSSKKSALALDSSKEKMAVSILYVYIFSKYLSSSVLTEDAKSILRSSIPTKYRGALDDLLA